MRFPVNCLTSENLQSPGPGGRQETARRPPGDRQDAARRATSALMARHHVTRKLKFRRRAPAKSGERMVNGVLRGLGKRIGAQARLFGLGPRRLGAPAAIDGVMETSSCATSATIQKFPCSAFVLGRATNEREQVEFPGGNENAATTPYCVQRQDGSIGKVETMAILLSALPSIYATTQASIILSQT